MQSLGATMAGKLLQYKYSRTLCTLKLPKKNIYFCHIFLREVNRISKRISTIQKKRQATIQGKIRTVSFSRNFSRIFYTTLDEYITIDNKWKMEKKHKIHPPLSRMFLGIIFKTSHFSLFAHSFHFIYNASCTCWSGLGNQRND